MNRILIVGPAWVGDMMMAQSLFKVLKQNSSQIEIDVLAAKSQRPLLERMPEVQQVIELPIQHGELKMGVRYAIAKKLRQTYDQAIVLPNSWKSALIPFLAKIPKRTGFVGECRFGLLNDIRFLSKTQLPKMVLRYASLGYSKESAQKINPTFFLESLPLPKLKSDPNQIEKIKMKFNLQDSSTPILALCPGAEFGPSKRWPEEYYAEIALAKIKAGWQVWLFGSEKEKAGNDKIQQLTKAQCADFTGKTNLGEAIDLLSLAHCVVSNDSGLMHIAAALEKPLVAIYGSTDPNFTPPLSAKGEIMRLNLSCSPCFKRTCPLVHHQCMRQLLPSQILNSLQKLGGQCGF